MVNIRAAGLAETLADIPFDSLSKLFLWIRENCEEIPKDRGFRLLWSRNRSDIENYRARAFAVTFTKRGPEGTKISSRDLVTKYPAFVSEIAEACKCRTEYLEPELFSRLMRKIAKEQGKAAGFFGQGRDVEFEKTLKRP